ncbi:MAG TPA: LEPR-XLL domain-containing protein, partial [Rariglobus sp.]
MSTRPRRTAVSRSQVTASSFVVEGLEARVLLSATPLPAPVENPADAASQSTVVQPVAAPAAATPLVAVPLSTLSPGLHLFNQEENSGGVIWVLSQEEIDELSAGKSIVYFGDAALSMHIVVGDGTDTPIVFSAPTTVLRGDTVRFSSPVIANELIIESDGSTTLVNADATGTSLSYIDSLLIDGSRKMTATGGNITITGNNAVNGSAGGATDNLTLNATGKVTFTGNVGDISDVSSGDLQDFTVENATDIAFQGSFSIAGNLLIKKGSTVTFTGAVSIGGNLTIEDGGAVVFSNGLTVTGDLTILKASSIQFQSNVSVGGKLSIGNQANYADVSGSVSFASNLTYEGTGSIFSGGAIQFGNSVGNAAKTPDSLLLGSNGAISFAGIASLTLGTDVSFIVEKATDVTFLSSVTAGSVTIGASDLVSGNVTFAGSTTVDSLLVKTTGAEATASFANLSVGDGGATVTANNIDFTSTSIVRPKVGSTTATLTLKPYDTARAISLGNLSGAASSGSAYLDLESRDINAIKAGFVSVNIGDAQAGTGAVYIGSIGSLPNANSAFLVNTTRIYGGSITVTQDFDVAKTASALQLVARTGGITINGTINATELANPTSNNRNAWLLFQAADNIVVNRAVYAADRISLIAGTDGSGSVTVDATGGNTGLLATISTAGVLTYSRRIELVAGETSGDILLQQTSLTVAAAVGFLSNLVLRANGGAITQTAGLLTASNLAFWAKGDVVINTAVDTIASATLEGAILPGGSGALATAAIDASGALTGISVNNGGSGYTVAPTVTILGDGRVLGTGTATIKGPVSSILVTSGGSGYTSAPTVSFTGGSGSGAVATATVINGVVVGITVNNGGTDYQSAPAVVLTGG